EMMTPIRPGDVITSASKIASIETKATGEAMVVELTATNQDGKAVGRTLFTVFIRGGGSGKAAAEQPPEPARGEPLLAVSQTIDMDQTFRYAEASGDNNPIHVDPNVAKMAGLPGIIVHGLCTMAFTSKVAIDKLADGDPTRLKRLHVRFARPVIPGDTITTRVWAASDRADRKAYTFEP